MSRAATFSKDDVIDLYLVHGWISSLTAACAAFVRVAQQAPDGGAQAAASNKVGSRLNRQTVRGHHLRRWLLFTGILDLMVVYILRALPGLWFLHDGVKTGKRRPPWRVGVLLVCFMALSVSQRTRAR